MYEVFVQVEGEVTYNGHALNKFVPEKASAYISQHDTHLGEMTVRETFNFLARCQGVGSRYGIFGRVNESSVHYILTDLGFYRSSLYLSKTFTYIHENY